MNAAIGPAQASIEDFAKLDIRVGRVISAQPNARAAKPAIVLRLDLGPEFGVRTSSAQITDAYTSETIIGRTVLAVVNLPPRNIAGVESEVLVLGVYAGGGDGPVVLVAPDNHPSVAPGDRLG